MEIIACKEGCVDCAADAAKYQELIDKLSEMHINGATDPSILCSATFKQFRRDHSEYQQYNGLQSELFEIANRHNLDWTKN